MTEVNEGVLRRIKALLALSANNSNEHEAAAAAQKALEMMEEYNLDATTVGTNNVVSGERKQNFVNGGLYGWQRKLWESAAKLNFCMYWSEKGLRKGDKYKHRVLGSPTNVLSAQLLAEYLQQTVERLAQTYAKENNYNVFAREMVAYREGMTTRLTERLSILREEKLAAEREREAEEAKRRQHPSYASSGTALVLSALIHTEEDYNNDYLNGWEPGTSARKRAERDAQSAAWKAENERKRAEAAERYRTDPEYAAAVDKLAAEQKAADDKWYADYLKKQAKRKEPKPRYRNMTAEEQRASMGTYRSGYAKGDTVGLSEQIDKRNSPKIR